MITSIAAEHAAQPLRAFQGVWVILSLSYYALEIALLASSISNAVEESTGATLHEYDTKNSGGQRMLRTVSLWRKICLKKSIY